MSYGIDQQDDNNNYFGPQVSHAWDGQVNDEAEAMCGVDVLNRTLKGSQNCGDLNTPATTTGFIDFILRGLKPPSPTTKISTLSESGS